VIEVAARALLVATLVAAAALGAELALRRMRLPTRPVWMLAAGANPVLALWPPHFEHSLYPAAVAAFSGSAHTSISNSNSRLLWLLCSALAAAWTLAVAIRLGRLIRGRPTLRLGGIELLVTGDLGPAVIGLLAPRVVVPRWFKGLSIRAQRLVLVHELAHMRARDSWTLGATLLGVLSMPWNPLQWWILYRARRAIELDCDERVLARGIPVRRYGEILIDVAARPLRSWGPASVVCATSDFLEQRIRIMTIRHRSPPLLPTLLIIAAALTAATGAVLADSAPADTSHTAKLEAEAAAAQEASKSLQTTELEAETAAAQEVEASHAEQKAKFEADAATARAAEARNSEQYAKHEAEFAAAQAVKASNAEQHAKHEAESAEAQKK
jgi:bla regulator protein blaR1